MIPTVHDYFAAMMGIDSVIVQRDGAGRIRVYLNKCRHRGNEVCIYEAGNADLLHVRLSRLDLCDGKLIGVPSAREAYRGEIELGPLGPHRSSPRRNVGRPHLRDLGSGAPSLDDYLGDAKWYLENFLLREEMGGLEIVPGAQKYMMPTNWKLLAENFAGDDYHFATPHASLIHMLARTQRPPRRLRPRSILQGATGRL